MSYPTYDAMHLTRTKLLSQLSQIDAALHEVDKCLHEFRTSVKPDVGHYPDYVDAMISLSARLVCLARRAEDHAAVLAADGSVAA